VKAVVANQERDSKMHLKLALSHPLRDLHFLFSLQWHAAASWPLLPWLGLQVLFFDVIKDLACSLISSRERHTLSSPLLHHPGLFFLGKLPHPLFPYFFLSWACSLIFLSPLDCRHTSVSPLCQK
jgi:hypothetical protein